MAEQKTKKEWYKRWWAITLFIIIGLSIIGSFLPDDNSSSVNTPTETNENTKTEISEPEEPLATEEQPETTSTTVKNLGISYNQMMNYLSNFFIMEKSTPVKGQDRYMGETSSGLAILEIIGEKDNIAQTTLIIGIPSDNQDIIIENSAILLRFLKNAVPEWEDSSDWATESLEKISSSTSNKEEKIYGDKLIKMSIIKELGMVTVTVKPK